MIVLRNKYFGLEVNKAGKKTLEELLIGAGLYHPYLKRAATGRGSISVRQKTGLESIAGWF